MTDWIRFTKYYRTRQSVQDALDEILDRRSGQRRDVQSYTVTHTYECRAALMLWRVRERLVRARYPRICLTCGGSGGWEYSFKPAPGPGYLQDWEDCPDCIGDAVCPRCGTDWLDHFDGDMNRLDDHQAYRRPCPVCGWDWEGMDREDCPDTYIPQRPDCLCYYELVLEG